MNIPVPSAGNIYLSCLNVRKLETSNNFNKQDKTR